jgi:hypothetical protein
MFKVKVPIIFFGTQGFRHAGMDVTYVACTRDFPQISQESGREESSHWRSRKSTPGSLLCGTSHPTVTQLILQAMGSTWCAIVLRLRVRVCHVDKETRGLQPLHGLRYKFPTPQFGVNISLSVWNPHFNDSGREKTSRMSCMIQRIMLSTKDLTATKQRETPFRIYD